ncbi:MAG: hypothetical protein M1828_000471 [Chrysothrix sp. TS-e1954]|nr:MAG: hypothetical protein M1828_000471 [Chrysothrix sp. TS-e1954]
MANIQSLPTEILQEILLEVFALPPNLPDNKKLRPGYAGLRYCAPEYQGPIHDANTIRLVDRRFHDQVKHVVEKFKTLLLRELSVIGRWSNELESLVPESKRSYFKWRVRFESRRSRSPAPQASLPPYMKDDRFHKMPRAVELRKVSDKVSNLHYDCGTVQEELFELYESFTEVWTDARAAVEALDVREYDKLKRSYPWFEMVNAWQG